MCHFDYTVMSTHKAQKPYCFIYLPQTCFTAMFTEAILFHLLATNMLYCNVHRSHIVSSTCHKHALLQCSQKPYCFIYLPQTCFTAMFTEAILFHLLATNMLYCNVHRSHIVSSTCHKHALLQCSQKPYCFIYLPQTCFTAMFAEAILFHLLATNMLYCNVLHMMEF